MMAMDDLISRKALLERLDGRTKTAYPNEFYGLMLAHDYIEEATAVEAKPVVHGRWIERGSCDYECSECGFRFTSADPIEMFKYCRCGAKMDGGVAHGQS